MKASGQSGTRGLNSTAFLKIITSVLFIGLFLIYFNVHKDIISNFFPLTVRETAFIKQSEGLLLSDNPPMYSWESLASQTNLYGPVYPYVASIPNLILESSPYLAHRLTSSAFLLLSCFLIYKSISVISKSYLGLIGAVFFYAITINSPSVAAGPDTLATSIYIASIALCHHYGFRRMTIFLSVLLGLLGLLTKAYVVLVIPGLLTYCYLFVSPRKAIVTGLILTLVCVAGYFLIEQLWPAYFHSVFVIHKHFATRSLTELLHQCRDFGLLNFSLIALLVLVFPYQKMFSISSFQWKRLYGNDPLFSRDPGIYFFMTLTAGVALLTVLGWHGGAYLIYFNHLLLPCLLLAVLPTLHTNSTTSKAGHFLLIVNALLLIIFSPTKPKPISEVEYLNLFPDNLKILADPVLDPIVRHKNNMDLVDTGQTEYLYAYNLLYKERIHSKNKIIDYLDVQAENIRQKKYDFLLLSPLHNRPHLFYDTKPTGLLEKNYTIYGKLDLPIYYCTFRDFKQFGKATTPIYIFKPKSTTDSG